MKYLKPTLVLLVICVVISGLLAVTYRVTYVPPLTKPADIVAAMSADYSEVLPGSAEYTLIYRDSGYEKMDSGKVVEAASCSSGYIFTVHSQGQYDSDPIRVMVGVGNDGTVSGIKILRISETPGLGLKTKSENWLSQVMGGSAFSLDGSVGSRIDGVTSATKSSKAVVNAVNCAMDEYARLTAEVE